MHKLLLDRDPVHGEALTSQPTLSRFENTAQTTDLYRVAGTLAETVIESAPPSVGEARPAESLPIPRHLTNDIG